MPKNVAFPAEAGVKSIAGKFGVGPGDLLGHGGKAWVFALGDERVLRILHPGGEVADIYVSPLMVVSPITALGSQATQRSGWIVSPRASMATNCSIRRCRVSLRLAVAIR
jgi:hypothetical protein